MANRTLIKICGVTSADIAVAAVSAGADMVGLVFVEQSPRYVDFAQAIDVAGAVDGKAQVVGLFKGHSFAEIHEAFDEVPIDMAQMHGPMNPGHVQELALPRFMRAVSFEPESIRQQISQWDAFHINDPRMVGLVIDAPDPSRIGGGTGRTFDWEALAQVLSELNPTVPIVLAGGLNPDNVAHAIELIDPWMVDVSSGVESARGVKDIARINQFCVAVRQSKRK